MPQSTLISRREALVGLAAAGSLAASPSIAGAPLLGPLTPVANRVVLGGFEVTTIFDGGIVLDGPHPIFGQNVEASEVEALVAANGLPPTKMEIGFTPVVVNTGSELVLFDTGNGAGRRPNAGHLRERLGAAGYKPEDIDKIVITHMHPDHIGGLMEDGAPAFPNATYVTGAAEYDFWSPEERLTGGTERVAKLVQSNVKPLAEKMSFIKPGDAVASGIEAVDAFGHTPGMLNFHIESDGKRVMLIADTANHFVASMQRPDWHVRFDGDKEKAAATRKRILGMISADKIPFTGYHMPFPAMGYLEAKGEGFHYSPETYQFEAAG